MDITDEFTPNPRTPLDFACDNLLYALVRTDADPRPSDFGAYAGEDPRGYLEGMLHEICHVVVLRRGVRAALRRPLAPSQTVGEAVPSFPEYDRQHFLDEVAGQRAERRKQIANQHEIDTIATEVIASRTLGMPFDPIDIAVYAVDGQNVVECGDYHDVAKLVVQAMKRPEVRRWGRDLGKHLSQQAAAPP